MKTTIHADQLYINGLINNDSAIINSIYKKFVPKVINYIKNNSGNHDQAQDVVQDILILLFNQAQTKKLQLICPFDAYFFLLCKRKWINELKKNSNKKVTISDDFTSTNESELQMAEQTEVFEEQQSLFNEMFEKLGEKCKELLKLSFSIKSLEEVAEKLNVTYGYVRKKKSICTGQLTDMIQETNRYKNIKTQ